MQAIGRAVGCRLLTTGSRLGQRTRMKHRPTRICHWEDRRSELYHSPKLRIILRTRSLQSCGICSVAKGCWEEMEYLYCMWGRRFLQPRSPTEEQPRLLPT